MAMSAAGAPADSEPLVRQSAKVQFGDYQANGVMGAAKNGYPTPTTRRKNSGTP